MLWWQTLLVAVAGGALTLIGTTMVGWFNRRAANWAEWFRRVQWAQQLTVSDGDRVQAAGYNAVEALAGSTLATRDDLHLLERLSYSPALAEVPGEHARCLMSNCPRKLTLALINGRKHNASMPNVLVRDVPDGVHAALQRRAERRHQSLQQYLAAELRELAEHRSISEILDEVEAQQSGRVGLRTAVADVDEERRGR